MLDVDIIGHNKMVIEERGGIQKSRSFDFRKILDVALPGRQAHSLILENGNGREAIEHQLKPQQIGSIFKPSSDKAPVSRLSKDATPRGASPFSKDKQNSELEYMKERFAKLLLGEDMSGGGKGVSSALALSNAITNLAASVFGEQSKLEPMSPERKQRWRKEVDLLLSVTDYIVEFVPSQQLSKDGKNMEIMVTQQRRDLLMNIPALRKLDAMLIDCLDNFQDANEFWYISRDADESEKGVQRNDKWWLPTVKVPPNGLSEASRKLLQYQKDCVNQVLKASMAINAQILSEMEIPENYIESLPKNGRASLGDITYKNITVEFFDPEQFLSTMDLSSEHKVLDLKNRIEASIVIWKRKMNQKDGKSTWGSAVSLEKRELFEERAETILLLLKQRFPGLPQSSLDICKIEYNRDVGHSILECYSRVLESLANTVMNRIEDVLYADSLALDPSLAVAKMPPSRDLSPSPEPSSIPPTPTPQDESEKETEKEIEKLSSTTGTPTATSMTLSDFMGWNLEKTESNVKKNLSTGNLEELFKDEGDKTMAKTPNANNGKKFSYMDKVESGLRSPSDRH